MTKRARLLRILAALLALGLQSLAPAAMAQRAPFLPPGTVLCNDEGEPVGFLDRLHAACDFCVAAQPAPPPAPASGLVRLIARRLRLSRPLVRAFRGRGAPLRRWARAPPVFS